jgi:hypothetical protein
MYTLLRNQNAQDHSPLMVTLSRCSSSPLLGILVHLVDVILQKKLFFFMNKTTSIAASLKEITTTL